MTITVMRFVRKKKAKPTKKEDNDAPVSTYFFQTVKNYSDTQSFPHLKKSETPLIVSYAVFIMKEGH